MKRPNEWRWIVAAAMLGGGTLLAGCDGEFAREFRTVAAEGLHDGITTIATSLIDGVFAVLTPDETP